MFWTRLLQKYGGIRPLEFLTPPFPGPPGEFGGLGFVCLFVWVAEDKDMKMDDMVWQH
jgi:hypothetical protein